MILNLVINNFPIGSCMLKTQEMAIIRYRTRVITAMLVFAALALVVLQHDPKTDDGLVQVKREAPLIWVGGVPRSGTTLMR